MMKRVFSIVVMTLLAITAYGQIDITAPLQRDPTIKYGQLKNGLTYYIMHNDKPANRAEYYLLTDVGAIQESKEQNGLAHFLEHMCLNGTQNLPEKMLIDYFESIGAGFGSNINASTGVEQTMYMLNNIPTTRQGIIDTALLVLHDYSHFVTNDPQEIDAERGVIIEEWRTRRNASWRVYEQLKNYIYKGSKYAECNVIGTKEGLESFPAEELVNFYQTWYRPDMQAVVVVGDIEPEAIYNQLEELFKDIPAVENPQPKEQYIVPDNVEPIVGIVTDPELRNTEVDVYIKSAPIPKEMKGTGVGLLNDMVDNIIAMVMMERYSDIYSKPNSPFLQADAYNVNLTQTLDAFAITAFCGDGEGETALKAALTEFEKVKRYGITQGEYDRACNNLLSSLEMAANNKNDRQNSQIVSAIQGDFFSGATATDPQYKLELAKGYLSQMDVALINQALASIDYSQNCVIIYCAPQKEGMVHPTEEALKQILIDVQSADIENNTNEDIATELLDPTTLKGAKVKKEASGRFQTTEWTLKNGIRVIVRPSTLKQEEVIMNIATEGGKSIFTEEEVLSLDDNFTSFISSSGVSDFSNTTLSKMLAGNTANVSPYISELSHGINGASAPKDIETLLQLAYLYCAEPRLVEEEFAPTLTQIKTILPNLVNDPSYKLSEQFYKTAYNSPRQTVISLDMVDKFSFDTMVNCYKKLFSNMAGAKVYITGNVDLSTLKPLVEKYIGSLPVGKKPYKYVDNNLEILPGKIENIFSTAMQTPKTTVMMAYTGIVPFTVENTIYMSALRYILDLIYTSTIREAEGATYGVSTSCGIAVRPKHQATISIQFDTNTDAAPRMITLAKDGLENIAKNGVSEEQLSKAKENLLKRIPEQRIQNRYWGNVMVMYEQEKIDTDSGIEEIIQNLNSNQLQLLVNEILSQNNLLTVVMNPTL